MFPSLPYKVA
uniref:Uncharacterized protein n=1 Tax=Anguilla anguilla TaxID=7936 RepID=A0A0E9VUV1_ANGAN